MKTEQRETCITFGKFLVGHLGLSLDSNKMDWDHLIKKYDETLAITSTPGLVYINWRVSQCYGQDPLRVRFEKRKFGEIVKPRMVAQYIACKIFGYGPTEIAKFYEYKQSGAVTINVKSIEGQLQMDKEFKKELEHVLLITYDYTYSENEITWRDTDRSSERVQQSRK